MTDDIKNELGQTNATDDNAQSQPLPERSRQQGASEQESADLSGLDLIGARLRQINLHGSSLSKDNVTDAYRALVGCDDA